MTLVDTNILIDIFGGDPVWADPSLRALADCGGRGPIAINDVVYAELAAGFPGQAELDEAIGQSGLRLAPMTKAALYLAGQTFRRYRVGGGLRPNVLADLFIGAQASAEGWPLLTRDASRYRRFFPDVALLEVEPIGG